MKLGISRVSIYLLGALFERTHAQANLWERVIPLNRLFGHLEFTSMVILSNLMTKHLHDVNVLYSIKHVRLTMQFSNFRNKAINNAHSSIFSEFGK